MLAYRRKVPRHTPSTRRARRTKRCLVVAAARARLCFRSSMLPVVSAHTRQRTPTAPAPPEPRRLLDRANRVDICICRHPVKCRRSALPLWKVTAVRTAARRGSTAAAAQSVTRRQRRRCSHEAMASAQSSAARRRARDSTAAAAAAARQAIHERGRVGE